MNLFLMEVSIDTYLVCISDWFCFISKIRLSYKFICLFSMFTKMILYI